MLSTGKCGFATAGALISGCFTMGIYSVRNVVGVRWNVLLGMHTTTYGHSGRLRRLFGCFTIILRFTYLLPAALTATFNSPH